MSSQEKSGTECLSPYEVSLSVLRNGHLSYIVRGNEGLAKTKGKKWIVTELAA